ncbi:50S ribosomal protein L6 [Candidatus Bathyarchaeota archaeon]|nr:MAG: 50S ribosomal protein L6 [Candidatus Bathyarchaeota archaeon]
MAYREFKVVEVPEGVQVEVEGKVVKVRGPLGELKRDFSHAPVEIRLDGNKVIVEAYWPKKRERAMIGTVAAHIRNMITGVTKGFTYKMKIVFTHFPIQVTVEGDRVVIRNFLGERAPRIAKILPGVKVEVQKEDVLVKGIDIEAVGQTAANIEQATKVKGKDVRVFLDGIYIYEKQVGM